MVIIIFIFGLIVGSFLNAVIWRLHTGESFINGRSYCPECKHVLGFWDLVPVFSFVFLGGKCRYCHKKISWQYPLVELITGILFALVYFNLYLTVQATSYELLVTLIAYLFFASILIIIFVYDLKYYLILDVVTIPAIVVAFLVNLYLGLGFVNLLLGALIAGGFFWLQFVLSKGKWIGGGDIRLGVLMGLILGWKLVLVALFLAYIIGAVVGVGLLAYKKKEWGSQVPFGTFLSLATVIALLWGEIILNWYWGLF